MSRVPGAGSALLAVLLLCSVGLVAATPATGSTVQETDGLDEGETVFRIDLHTDGDARIQIIERFPVTTEAEEAAFDEIATAFEDEAYSLYTVSEFENASEIVDERTDREMTLSAYEWNGTLVDTEGGQMGELTVAFTWESFARVAGQNNQRLHVDDVLVTDQGPWLRGLTARQSLVIGFPENHGVRNATVSPQGGELRWSGPTTFDEQTLQATFIGNNQPSSGSGWAGLGTAAIAVVLLVGFLIIIGLAALFVRYRDKISGVIGTSDGDPQEDIQGHSAGDTRDDGEPLDSTSPETDRSPLAEAEPAGAAPVIDEELLSDEERVERLLERNGGRMKQADIVEETDWSNAKVSQLLSSMEEEGHIDKLRIGRENLISFPDVDLTDSDNTE